MDQNTHEPKTLDELLRGWQPYAGDLLLHDPGGLAESVVRRGELLIPGGLATDVLDGLGSWVDRVRHHENLGVARARLRASEEHRCVEIARDRGAAANHVHVGATVMVGSPVMFGTGARARASPPVPAPAEQVWDVSVGLLDTGIDPHPWFADRPWFEEIGEVLDADDDSGQDRAAGHGTFAAGLVLRHAPGAVLRVHRTLSSLGFTDDVRVAEGLRAFAGSTDVVLVTSGCHTPDDTCPPVLESVLESVLEPGQVVVAAAGNHGCSRPFWPAALPEVVAVAATGPDGSCAEFSNRGDWVDAAAPGVDVVSSYVSLVPGAPRDRSYGCASWSGTSFAAPQVAASVAAAVHAGHGRDEAAEIACRAHPFGRS